MFDKEPEILTRGHAVSERRVAKLEERANFSKYLILPTNFGFRKLVRIYSFIFSFCTKLVRDWLASWVESFILVGDSTISLYWVSSVHKKLSLYHRNRVLQILRGTSLDKMFHIKTEHNPSDLGTRPRKVSIDQVLPNSSWFCGA